MTMKRGFYTIGCSLLVVGCSVGPVYEPPEMDLPSEWHSGISTTLNSDASENVVWWKCLQDPILDELMAYAAIQNLDLQMAAIRVMQARVEANGKKGNLYPHVDGSVNYGHVSYSKDALVNGALSSTLPIDRQHAKRNLNFFELGFDAEWEIDFFGYTAHEIAALKAREEALQENLCSVWVTLSAEIAKNYIELRGLQQRLVLATKHVDVQTDVVKLTTELLERGLVNESDVSDAKSEWNRVKSEIPAIELNISRAIHRISILLGYLPGDLFELLSCQMPLPCLPKESSIGVPSELLRRRPDIKKAEREVAAATERVGSAIAALFPRFSLRGFLGDITTHTGSLFSPSNVTWYAGPQVLVPIFNSKLLLQDVKYNRLATQEALLFYQKTVLEALEESENAIAAYQCQEQRLSYLTSAHQEATQALEHARSLYKKGVHDLFTVSKFQRSSLITEELMMQNQAELLLNYISLYKALGGSWERTLN
jgi:multidrug efflux system outer membrane protein